jgi:hypothetical protein
LIAPVAATVAAFLDPPGAISAPAILWAIAGLLVWVGFVGIADHVIRKRIRPGVVDRRTGLVRVFATREEAYGDIKSDLQKAQDRVRIQSVCLHAFLGRHYEDLRECSKRLDEPVRVITTDPDSLAFVDKAVQDSHQAIGASDFLRKRHADLEAWRTSALRLATIAGDPKVSGSLRVVTSPLFMPESFFIIDKRVYVTPYVIGRRGSASPCYVFEDCGDAGSVYRLHAECFDSLWDFLTTRRDLLGALRTRMVGVDFDGVLADTNAKKVQWIKDHLGKDVGRWQCNRSECVRSGVMTEVEYNRMAHHVYSKEETARIDPVEGACEAVVMLSEVCGIVVVTARQDTELDVVRSWLVDNGLEGRVSAVISVCGNGHGSDGGKTALCEGLGLGVLIDDDERHLTPGKQVRVCHFVLDKAGGSKRVGVELCKSWKQVLQLVAS